MPTYEYACRACGHTFEVVQSMSDDPLTTCPRCAGELRKVFAPPAIAFKGSGFYATDHGKKAKSSDKGSESPGKGADGGRETSKKEGKEGSTGSSGGSGSDASKGSSGSGSGGGSSTSSSGSAKGSS